MERAIAGGAVYARDAYLLVRTDDGFFVILLGDRCEPKHER
jgi:hypothetical protein